MKANVYKIAKGLGLKRRDVDRVLAKSTDVYTAGTYYWTVSPKDVYKAGTYYGTVSARDLYKAGTYYGTISIKDF